ncbi:hypothetical protein TrLO_g7762 [Triparma laevis f. longispina]|uniref:Uncharacterized protein n=1 Tax=Triparma laevis f. longispina TaxID=1714387 RepID=A0A9W7KTS9_9STRA|nr:hypothetical protein TrLO_g7762 [Triparma laevis f. longispina]
MRTKLAAREVKWHVSTSASTEVSPEFFSASSFPEQVLRATPSIDYIEYTGENTYTATVTQTSFPLVTLTPKMTFEINVSEPAADKIITSVKLIDQQMEATGPSFATRIILAASRGVQTESTTTFELSDTTLTASAFVNITMKIPRWVPIPTKTIQSGGQTSMEKQVTSDLQSTISALSTK